MKVSVARRPNTSLCFPSAATHAVLHPLLVLEEGEYAVPVLVSDSGRPALTSFTHVNITVCLCDSSGDCKSAARAVLGSSMGISFIALIIVLACIALLRKKSNKLQTQVPNMASQKSRTDKMPSFSIEKIHGKRSATFYELILKGS